MILTRSNLSGSKTWVRVKSFSESSSEWLADSRTGNRKTCVSSANCERIGSVSLTGLQANASNPWVRTASRTNFGRKSGPVISVEGL